MKKGETIERSQPTRGPRIAHRIGGTLGELAHSGQIHVALALGFSIVVLAWVSKRVLDEPMRALALGAPSLVVLGYELATKKYGDRRLARSRYWVAAVLLTTAVVIVLHLI